MGSFPPQSGRPCRGVSCGTFTLRIGLTIMTLLVSVSVTIVKSIITPRSDLSVGRTQLKPRGPELRTTHPDMLAHAGVDAPQSGRLNNIVQTAMVRRVFDRLTMDVLLAGNLNFRFSATFSWPTVPMRSISPFWDLSIALLPAGTATLRK